MRQQYLNDAESVDWMRDKLAKYGVETPAFESFVIEGNEDAPERVELYTKRNAQIFDVPVFVWTPDWSTL